MTQLEADVQEIVQAYSDGGLNLARLVLNSIRDARGMTKGNVYSLIREVNKRLSLRTAIGGS